MSAISIAERESVSQAASATSSTREFLSLRLGAEEYGIDILWVQEIRSHEPATRIAGAPESVQGVLNLRGVIVPIVDLRRHFASEPRFDAATVTIVLNVRGRTVGVTVDSVSDVIGLQQDQIKPVPAFNQGVAVGHITGIATLRQGDGDRTLILLDIEQLLSGADIGLSDPSDR
ncbi:MAG TPA: chemotaxis protein CheW [Rhizobacter sp.]